MKSLLFSDIHGSLTNLKKVTQVARLERCSLLVFAGDFLNMGRPHNFADDLVDIVRQSSIPLLWVSGNNDFGYGYERLQEIYPSIEGRVVEYGGRMFAGITGSTPLLELGSESGRLIDPRVISGTIFVSHYPPPGKINYERGDTALSPALTPEKQKDHKIKIQDHSATDIRNTALSADSWLTHSPLLHVCGHIHHEFGIGQIGNTRVVKLGAAVDGHYAILNLNTLTVEFGKLS